MSIYKNINPYKSKFNLASVILFSFLLTINAFAQFGYVDPLEDLSTLENTGEKPQSKVWKYDNQWWCVMPSSEPGSSGTWLFHLNTSTWAWDDVVRLTTSTSTHADCKVYGSLTYVLLVKSSSADLYKLTYSSSTYSSSFVHTISLDSGVETATIDIDSEGIMWLASDAGNDNINVRWSASPYTSWSSAKILKNTGDNDDICAVTAFDGDKIGVLWSNQDDKQFQFSYHLDSNPTTTWSTMEGVNGPVSGGHFADDHINLAVKSDGTLYAAVKTSYGDYDSEHGPEIALLERSTSGTWSTFSVANTGTRPIVLLNETEEVITVVYTDNSTSSDDIVYRQSDFSASISFGSKQTLIAGSYNNVTSTKQNYTDEVVVLADGSSGASGVMAYTNDPTPVELAFFSGLLNGNEIELRWRTETEVNNYGFDIERAKDNSDWLTIGFVEGHGNSNSPKQYNFIDTDIDQSGTYYYRLKQIDNDGTYKYYDVVSVEVSVPDNFYLSQNYPNPFNPETRIDFTLPEKQFVSLRVYNTLGELVGELVNEERDAGNYSVTFDASNLPSGVYIYRLQTSSFAANKKMTLLR